MGRRRARAERATPPRCAASWLALRERGRAGPGRVPARRGSPRRAAREGADAAGRGRSAAQRSRGGRAVGAAARGVDRRCRASTGRCRGPLGVGRAGAPSCRERSARVAAPAPRRWRWRSTSARAKAGADRLADIDGVLGTLLDVVEVDVGWEAAFEAAAGEALSAVVVEGREPARRAIAALHDESLSGAVLALGGRSTPRTAPPVGERLRNHVRSHRPEVEQLLERASSATPSSSRAGGSERSTSALAHPDAIVVTADGDRFGLSGLAGRSRRGRRHRCGARRGRAAWPSRPAFAVEQAASRLGSARAAVDDARRVEGELGRSLDDNDGRLTAAGDGLQRVETDRRDAVREADTLQTHLDELTERVDPRTGAGRRARSRCCPTSRRPRTRRAESGRRMGAARTHLEEQAAEVGALRTDLEVRPAAVDERRQFLSRRLGEVEERLERRRGRAGRGRSSVASSSTSQQLATDRLIAFVTDRSTEIDTVLVDLRERRRRQSEAARAVAAELDALRRERADAEQQLGETPRALAAPRARGRRDQAAHRDRGRGAAPRPRRRARRRPWPPSARRWPRASTPAGSHPRARARAADHGPDQPAGPRGVRGAAGAPRVPAEPARRRQGVPPRAGQGHQGHRRRDRQRVRRRVRRRGGQLRAALRHACSPAARAASSSPTPTTCSTPASRSRPGRRART